MINIKLKDNKYFLEKLSTLQPDIFKYVSILDEYNGVNTKLRCKCKKCGNYFLIAPSNLYKGIIHKGCKRMLTTNDFKRNLYSKFSDFDKYLILVDEYHGRHNNIKVKCKKCGRVFNTTPGRLYDRKKCLMCYGTPKKSTSKHYAECKEKGFDLPVGKYKNDNSKMDYKCGKCDSIYTQKVTNHLQGNGCPVCNESHGERFIRNYLDSKGISYEAQKTFPDLFDKGRLSYDFYLPEYNTLIEYQGIQHYESINFKGNGKYSNLEKQQHHDNLKRKYAKDNGYRLLELHYSLNTQDKVNKFLNENL